MRKLIFVLVAAFQLHSYIYAQNQNISVLGLKKNYTNWDTIVFRIENLDSNSFNLVVGIEKNVFGDFWLSMSDNILWSQDEIEGRVKADLQYYLPGFGKVVVKKRIPDIALPISIKLNDSILPNKKYRIAYQKDKSSSEWIGKFRFSIRIQTGMYASEYLVLKTKPFVISN